MNGGHSTMACPSGRQIRPRSVQAFAIRSDTETWVYSYLSMAYQPLADSDLEAYVALSETEAGRVLNRALFEGFDQMDVAISRALGTAAARFMAGEDI